MIDVFKVGVHIGMSTNSSQILSVMMRELAGVEMAAGKVEKSLGNIKALAIGAGVVFAGWAVAKGLLEATKHAEKLNHELVKLKIGMHLTDAQTNAVSTSAFGMSRAIPGTNVADLVKQRRELAGTLGSMEHADQVAPLVAQGSAAVSSYVDKDTDLAKLAVKALEIRGHMTKDGKVDPVEFATEFNDMVRAIVASEGLITPQALLAFVRQAGPAARSMSSEEMWGSAPAIMNALGASKAGTAFMSLYAQMVGHVLAGKRVAVAEEEAGFIKPKSWHTGRGGKVIMDQDSTVDQRGFADHPIEWLHTRLEEMRKKVGKDGKPIDTVAVIQRIFQLASRATSARLISDIDANWATIQAEKNRYDRTPGVAGIRDEQNDKDLSVNIKNLNAAWDNFQTALGGPGIPIVIHALHQMSDALNVLQAAAVAHPEVAKALFEFAAAVGSFFLLGPGISIASGVLKSFGDVITGFVNLIKNIHFPDMPTLPGWLGGGGGTPGASPNVPWSGKTYGPHGNTNPDGTAKHSWNTLPRELFPPRDSPSFNSAPVRVTIDNPHDIGHAVSGGLARGMSRPNAGPSYDDYRHSYPAPAFGSLA